MTRKFRVGDTEGYFIVGLYPDGATGELFIHVSKEGATLSGALNCFAVMVSIALQSGISLKKLADKFVNVRFEPDGLTGDPEIPMASSIVDYIMRWMAKRFCHDGLTAKNHPQADETGN